MSAAAPAPALAPAPAETKTLLQRVQSSLQHGTNMCGIVPHDHMLPYRTFQGDVGATKLRELIGCRYFQMVPVPGLELELWVDEDGMEGKPINAAATAAFGPHLAYPDMYGTVVVVRPGVVE